MLSRQPRTSGQNRYYSLQILRGIAALMVVVFHIKGYIDFVGNNPETIYRWVPDIFGFGAPLFFVISGFVMALVIEQSNFKAFVYKRFLRIYPPFIIAAILVIFVKVLIIGNVSFNNLFFALTLLPLGNSPTYPLSIEWTLIYEVFFYILCSVFTIKYMKKFFFPFLLVWGIIISLAHYSFGIPTEPLTTLKLISFSTFNYYFIVGALVYYLPRLANVLSQKVIALFVFLITIIIFILYYNMFLALFSQSLVHVIFSILFGILVYFIVHLQVGPSTVSVRSGDYSYGIYLIHAQTMFIVLTVWKDILDFPINSLAGSFALIVALVVSWNFGKFEYWLHNRLKNFKFPVLNRKQLIKAVLAGMLLLFVIAVQHTHSLTPVAVVLPFDSTNVINDKLNSGWVDTVSAVYVESNQAITFTGWAIDPFLTTPASNVILVSDNTIIPAEISWFERRGLTEVFNTDSVLMSGFTLTTYSEYLKSNSANHIDVYAVTEDDRYVQLQVVAPISIIKK